MKLVYLVNSNGDKSQRGALKKVLHEKECFEKLGYEVKLFIFHTANIGFSSDQAEIISLSKDQKSTGLVATIAANLKLANRMVALVRDENPDIIYFRDRGVTLNLIPRLCRLAPTFVEVQSMLGELRVGSPRKYILEKLLRRRYYRNVSGFVCITEEILQEELKYNSKPGYILGNGVVQEDLGFLPKVDANGLINLVCIASPGMAWHGIERLLDSYTKAPNKARFALHIIGRDDTYGLADPNIHFYGQITDSRKVDEIFAMSDIGVGSLALYKNGMQQAAPLKVRHYMGKGLPVLIGYDDVDLSEDLPFVLRVPNTDELMDFERIEAFHNRSAVYRANGDVCKFARENLLWELKIAALNDFIMRLVRCNSPTRPF